MSSWGAWGQLRASIGGAKGERRGISGEVMQNLCTFLEFGSMVIGMLY